MKLGILTFYNGPNYGGFWQARGLQNYLTELGYQAEMIPYLNCTHLANIKFKPCVYRRPMKFIHDWSKYRAISFACKRSGWKFPDSDPQRIFWANYDVIVVGSDVVWNLTEGGFGQDKIYYGCIQTKKVLRWISYAPSIGSMPEDFVLPDKCRLSLSNFAAVSARDEPTARFVHRAINITPPVLVDPTWLPSKLPTHNFQASRATENILLVYAPTISKKTCWKARPIINFARRHGLRIVANGIYQPWADENVYGGTPESWADLFRISRFAVCGTLHGALFSIREKLPFVCLATAASASKLSTPLKRLGLSDRWLPESEAHRLGDVLSRPIDFDRVEYLRVNWAEESARWLKNALVC